MAEKLTIQERIAQQFAASLDAALPDFLSNEVSLGVMTSSERSAALALGAQDFDPRGSDLPWYVPFVLTGPTEVEGESGGTGSGGYLDLSFSFRVQVHFGVAEGVDLSAQPARGAERMARRWMGFVIETLMADPQVIEGATSEPLAHEVELLGYDTPRSKTDGQVYYVPEVDLAVMSEVERNNPYRGAGNTERTV